MSLVINHNMMAMNTARNLNNTYGRLSNSVARLSSGLRINSAADDAAGLAIRELMRADITTMQQGVRNAADAISMIQTADGGMAVIDEKLTRMKELAEQAATGTYTTLQREIINSEYQAMAAEIDRIATANNFNGVKLLDGSITNLHGGLGMKIHFGVGNKESEDYYFINTGDVRATSSTGLRIGGDAKNDIWGQGAAGSTGLAGPGCCTAGYDSLDGVAGFTSGDTFAYGYNWDWMEDDDADLLSGKYLAGRYAVGSSWSLQNLIDSVNRGTQSRVGIQINSSALASAVINGGTAAVCVGDEAYIFGSSAVAGGKYYVPASPGGDGFKATGTYTGALFNSTTNIKLTAAQATALTDAGFDLTALGFTSASVTATGSAVSTTSAAAKADLLTKIQNQWNALGLSSMSGLALAAGATSNINTGQSIVNANGQGVIDPVTSAIMNGKTLTINTGVYTDANGNWTDNKDIAKALNMEEVIYRLENPNISEFVVTGTYTSPYAVINAGSVNSALVYSGATAALLAAAGLSTVSSVNVTANCTSNISSAAGKAFILTSAQSQLNDAFGGPKAEVIATRDPTATGVTTVDLATVLASAISGTNVTSLKSSGTIIASGSLTVNTGIFIDANGNYTYDTQIASAFNFSELVYTFTAGATPTDPMTVTAAYGGTTLTNTGYTTALVSNITLGDLAAGLGTAIKTAIDALSNSPDSVQLTKGSQVNPAYLLQDASQLNPTVVETTASPTAPLVVTASYNGDPFASLPGTDPGFSTAPPSSTTVPYLSTLLNSSLTFQVGQLMTAAASLSPGYIYKTTGSPTPAPSSLLDLDAPGAAVTAAVLPPTEEQTIEKKGAVDSTKYATVVADADTAPETNGHSNFGAWALASAINNNARSQFWAMYQEVPISGGGSAEMVYVFVKEGGDFNSLLACDVSDGATTSIAAKDAISFENLETGRHNESGTSFSLGGQNWGTFKPIQTKAGYGNEVWNLTLHGRDVGNQRDLWIAALSDGENELVTPGLSGGIINGLDRHSFVQIQNAADGDWAGAEVRTQSSAQEALEALNGAMERKDKVRADIGALQNRLENTITNLEIQIESLQASESRISDVDVATEMTEFVRNQVLAQAAVSMLSQANSLPQMALSLLNG